MKRRTLFRTAAATTAVAAAGAFPAPAIAQNRLRWRMVTTWPKNLPGLGTGAQYFADQVTRRARILAESAIRGREIHLQADQPLLRSVVDVAFEPAECRALG